MNVSCPMTQEVRDALDDYNLRTELADLVGTSPYAQHAEEVAAA